MKRLALLTVLAIVPASMVLAQSSLDDEINAELDRMYQTQRQGGAMDQSRSNAPSVQVNVQASPNQNQVSGQTQDTQTSVEARAVQKQATTVIEASPLGDSRAERLRKARQDAELQTEEKLVERIEHSRLEDERRRAEVLFGDRFSQMMQKAEQKSEQQTEQKQVIVNKNYGVQGDVSQGASASSVQKTEQDQKASPVMVDASAQAPIYVPVPVIVKQQDIDVDVKVKKDTDIKIVDKDDDHDHHGHHGENRDVVVVVDPNDALKGKRGYVSGMVGLGEYPDVENVRGNYSLGFAIGSKIDDRLLLEGSFQYSNFSIQQIDSGPWGFDPYYGRITEMNQYNMSGVAKYQILGGMFRPVIGGVASYNYRTFSDVQMAFANNDASSHAFDLGLLTGADLEVTRDFSIGADFRYMWNVYSRSSNEGFQRRFSQSVSRIGTPIEELSYYTFSIVGRATF